MRGLVALALAMVLLAGHASDADAYYRYGYRGAYYGPRVGVYVGSPWYWGPSLYWGAPYGWGAPYSWGSSWAWSAPWYGAGYPYGRGYAGWPYDAAAGYAGTPVYTERNAPPAAAPGSSWYYCQDPAGYYPHVSLCNRPWLEVAPFTVQPDKGPPATSR